LPIARSSHCIWVGSLEIWSFGTPGSGLLPTIAALILLVGSLGSFSRDTRSEETHGNLPRAAFYAAGLVAIPPAVMMLGMLPALAILTTFILRLVEGFRMSTFSPCDFRFVQFSIEGFQIVRNGGEEILDMMGAGFPRMKSAKRIKCVCTAQMAGGRYFGSGYSVLSGSPTRLRIVTIGSRNA
jgi:hypothetical protein